MLEGKIVKDGICAALFCFGNSESQLDYSSKFFVASELSISL